LNRRPKRSHFWGLVSSIKQIIPKSKNWIKDESWRKFWKKAKHTFLSILFVVIGNKIWSSSFFKKNLANQWYQVKRAKFGESMISSEQKRCRTRDLIQSWNISTKFSRKIRSFTKLLDWNGQRVRLPSRIFRSGSHRPVTGNTNSDVNTSQKAELHYSKKFGKLVELWRQLWIEFSQ